MPPKIQLKGQVEEDAYSKVLESARESITRFGDAVSNFGSKLGDMLRVPLAALAGTAHASSERFREAAFALRRTTGATGEKLDGLLGSFDRARAETRASIDDTAAVVGALSEQLGLTGDELSDASIAVLRIARAAGGGAAQTAGAVADMAAAWGISGRDLASHLEGFRGASVRAAGGASELAALLTRSAPTLKTLGLSFDDAVAMLAEMDAAGVPADAAIAGLTKGLTKLAKDGATDIRAALLDHVDKIVRAPNASAAAGEAAELFGKNGLAMADAARKGLLAVDAANRRLRSGIPSERLSRALDGLRIKVETAIRPLGQAIDKLLIPAMVSAMNALGAVVDVVGRVVAAFGSLPEWLQTTIVVVAGIAAIVGPALLFAGTVLKLATAFIGKHLLTIVGLKVIPAALGAIAFGAATGAALGFNRGLESAAQAGPAVKASVVAAGLVVGGIGADAGNASAAVVDSVSRSLDGAAASTARVEMPKPEPLPSFVPPAPARFDATPPVVPGISIPKVETLDLPPIQSDWSGAFDWARQFADAMTRSSTIPFVSVPMYGDVRGGPAPTGDAALAFLAQVGRLRGIRFNTDPAAIESEVARARAMLTLGDTYRLHAWNMEPVYNQIRNMIVGPTPILDMNSPEAWMLRATEVDRVISENASRTQYFADQRAANDAFWIAETTQRNQWSQWNARQQQQALTMANPRPNVYLPEDIMRAAGQAFNQAFGSGGSFGAASAPPPPPAAPAPARRSTPAPQVANFSATVGRKAPETTAQRPGRSATMLPDEISPGPSGAEQVPAGQRFGGAR